ncbi:hypothetical protein PRIC2_014317 [Phytophthora ramorum]|uniref:Histidine acid phosphatase n=1 Tax=Phytophthora ramorum TaxID=164328 RepID=H3H2U7_PHYRM
MSQEGVIQTARGDNVQADDVYVLRSSVPRTIESVLCLLRGFLEKQKCSRRQSQVGYGSDCTIARTCYGALKDCVKEVYDFVKSVVDNKQPAKLSFFSAHDNSMAALLNALQIDVESQIP